MRLKTFLPLVMFLMLAGSFAFGQTTFSSTFYPTPSPAAGVISGALPVSSAAATAARAGEHAVEFGAGVGAAGLALAARVEGLTVTLVEIDAALKNRWDNYRLSPDTIWVGSQVANDLSKKILAGNSNAAQRFVFDAEQGALGGGVMVRTYLNKFSMAGPK
ncbi:MAG: hypothetical protein ABR611_16310, partial [Chthoniobacterales bacterium]